MATRLLIVDHYDSPALSAVFPRGPDDAWEVFFLGGSPEWFAWRHPERARALSQARILDAAPFADRAHDLVNEFVVRISDVVPRLDLGGATLLDLLRSDDVNRWWFLQTSEKGPYRSPLIGQLYRLALAKLVADEVPGRQVRFSISEPALAATIGRACTPGRGWSMAAAAPADRPQRLEQRPYARLAGIVLRAFGRFAATWAFARRLPRPAPAPAGARWVFTVFPSWWNRVETGSPGDRFLTEVRDAGFAGYIAWLAESRLLWRNAAAVRAAAESLRLVALQRFLSLRDGLQVLSPARFARLRQFERRMRHRISLQFLGFDVGPLYGDDISRSLSSQEPIQDELLTRALRRAAGHLRIGTVVYRAEFQPIETAILTALRGQATAIGFHHHPFGRNYPQMYFTPGQIREGLDPQRTSDVRPLPDGIVAIGSDLAGNVAAGGFPLERTAVCGPQRYGPLTRYRANRPAQGDVRAKLGLPPSGFLIFVALAIVEADTEALFGALVGACRDLPEVRLVVKTHPNRPKGDPALHATLDALGRARATLMPETGSMYDYIVASDCMVCIGSMIAFEAMALGTMPIVFDNPSTYASVSLAAYTEGLFNVRNARELRAAIESLRADAGPAREKRQRWPELLGRVMGDLTRPLPAQMNGALSRLETAGRRS